MSAFGASRHSEATDQCSLSGVKRTLTHAAMSAIDPKRTSSAIDASLQARVFTFAQIYSLGLPY
jgi:hypothetical protein